MADRRAQYRQGLNKLYLPVYDFLCANLPEEWQPYYGLRTIEEQDKLFAQGRTAPGKIVTQAAGGLSPHNYGMATDWTIFVQGQPLWTLPPSEWSLYATMIEKAGGIWGGDFKTFKDKPHNEIDCSASWKNVNQARLKSGVEVALKLIEDSLIK